MNAPFVVLWRVMDACNLSCPFCAYDKRLSFQRSTTCPTEVKRMISLLTNFHETNGRRVLISWLGGEPTLWKDFAATTDHAFSAGLSQSLTTNGTTLGSSKTRAQLVERFSEITLSVDALGKLHEELRGWKGGFSKLSKWVPELVSEAVEAKSSLRVRANVVLMHSTLPDFEDLCVQLLNWGISQITFNQLGGRDRPEFYPANRLLAEDINQLKRFLPHLRLKLQKMGTELLGGDPYVERIADTTHNVALRIDDCQVAQDFLFIDENCTIAPCAFVGDHFGIKTQDIRSVQQFKDLPDRLCKAQNRCPANACSNCMSTQQFSKFAI